MSDIIIRISLGISIERVGCGDLLKKEKARSVSECTHIWIGEWVRMFAESGKSGKIQWRPGYTKIPADLPVHQGEKRVRFKKKVRNVVFYREDMSEVSSSVGPSWRLNLGRFHLFHHGSQLQTQKVSLSGSILRGDSNLPKTEGNSRQF